MVVLAPVRSIDVALVVRAVTAPIPCTRSGLTLQKMLFMISEETQWIVLAPGRKHRGSPLHASAALTKPRSTYKKMPTLLKTSLADFRGDAA